MDRHGVPTVAVLLVVLLAGCTGLSGSDSTPTPAVDANGQPAQTDTATPTQAASDGGTYPAGWSETGIENRTVAFSSHYRAMLIGPSATVTFRSGVIEAQADGATNTTLRMQIDTGERRLYASLNGTTGHRENFFTNGTFSDWDAQNQTLVRQVDAPFIRVAQSIDNTLLKSQLLLYELQLEETTTWNGTPALIYNVTGVTNSSFSPTYGSATAASGHLVVSLRGRILDIDTTVTYTGGTVDYQYAHTRIGDTTVETPEWLPDS